MNRKDRRRIQREEEKKMMISKSVYYAFALYMVFEVITYIYGANIKASFGSLKYGYLLFVSMFIGIVTIFYNNPAQRILRPVLMTYALIVPAYLWQENCSIVLLLPFLYGHAGFLKDKNGESKSYTAWQYFITLVTESVIISILPFLRPTNLNTNRIVKFMVILSTMIQTIILLRKNDSDLQLLMEKLIQKASDSIHDPMTKLKNKETMMDEIKSSMKNNNVISIIMIDIDNFKKVNDTYGHPFGDVVIKELADSMKKNIRKNDDAFRYGGEEFLILLRNSGAIDAKWVGERIREHFNKKTYEINGQKLNFSISLGVAEYRKNMQIDADRLLKYSDLALYESKQTGKNKLTIYEEKTNKIGA